MAKATTNRFSKLDDEQLGRAIEEIALSVADYKSAHERAQELYQDEPTRAHDDYVKETKRDLKWAEGQLRRAQEERDSRRGN